MEKIVVIINGSGGVGKDTVCDIVAKKYPTMNISSIDPIKRIAEYGGWDPTDKSLAARKLLADIKAAYIQYNNLPFRHIVAEYNTFLESDYQILFVHIREAEEIIKFKEHINTRCISLLISSDRSTPGTFGNPADDNVEDFSYDYVYISEKSEPELSEDVLEFFSKIISSN